MDNELASLGVIFTEFYYWLTVVLMFLIHIGFCMYEVGASRHKNHMHTLMKNTMLIPLVTITFFFFGWWIYWAFPNGPCITGCEIPEAASANTGWSQTMGPHMGDRITGVSNDGVGGDVTGWRCARPRSFPRISLARPSAAALRLSEASADEGAWAKERRDER